MFWSGITGGEVVNSWHIRDRVKITAQRFCFEGIGADMVQDAKNV